MSQVEDYYKSVGNALHWDTHTPSPNLSSVFFSGAQLKMFTSLFNQQRKGADVERAV